VRRPALLIGTGAVVLVLVLLVVLLLVRDAGGDGRDDGAPAPTAPASTPPAEAMTTVLSSSFDEGDEGWSPLGDGVQVAAAQDVTHDGAGSLLVSGRSEAWHGAAVDLSGSLARGQVHTVSAWVRLGDGAPDADVQLTLERDPGSEDPLYVHVARAAASSGDWVELSGTAPVPEGDGEWRLYVETTESTADLRLDDVTVQRPTPEVQTDVTALKDATEVPLGVAVGPQDLTGRPAELLLRHFDQLTPENAMKPITVQPAEGELDFGPMDEVLDFAAAHGLTVHGHTLVWHRSTPDWFFEAPDGRPLTGSAEDRALLLDRLRTHTRAIADHLAERYGDASPVTSWDVVNEALDPQQPDGLRHSRWYEVLGPGYVAEAFRIAREELGPDVALYLNDYDTDAPDRRRGLVRLVMDLQAAGAPVDGVGHQMHVDLNSDVDRVATTLDAVAALGVRQAVTELDVAISGRDEQLDRTPPDRLEAQRGQVRALVAAFAQRDLAFVGVWGRFDTRSWLRAWPEERPYEAPLLFDDDLQAKPAYEGFLEGLGGAG
jgi:endo-1,4-beta-xylanase